MKKLLLLLLFVPFLGFSQTSSDTTLTNITVKKTVDNYYNYRVSDSILFIELIVKEYQDGKLTKHEFHEDAYDLRLPENDKLLKEALSKKLTDELDKLTEKKKKKL